jgi:hypothetical protein
MIKQGVCMQKKILLLIGLLLFILACIPTQPQPTQDVEAIVQATFQALTLQALEPAQPTLTSTPSSEVVAPTATTIAVTTGSIAGNLSYPSSFIPAQTVVAFDVNSASYYYIETVDGQGAYQIDNLPAGTYYVVAYIGIGIINTGDSTEGLMAGYSQAVPCGLSVDCTDNSLIPVTVIIGQVTNNVNPQDWYAPPGSFPALP